MGLGLLGREVTVPPCLTDGENVVCGNRFSGSGLPFFWSRGCCLGISASIERKEWISWSGGGWWGCLLQDEIFCK